MWVSDEILAGWPLISQARWLAIGGGPGIRTRSIAANHPEFLLPKSVLARTLVVTVAALAVGTASATVKNDVAAADALTTAVTKALEPSLFCEGVDQAKLEEWSSEVTRLIPVVHRWWDKKRRSPKWGGPTSDAIAGLRVANAKLTAARSDFDACLDWREVRGEWTAAAMSGASTAGPSVARLAKANLSRTKSAAYALPRYGPMAAGSCAKVLAEYLEGTSGAFAAGPVVDSAVELDVLSTLQRCGGVHDGAADERMALILTDADLSGVVAGSADPGVIVDSLKAALDSYPADVEKGRYDLIQSAVVKLRLAVEATTKALTAKESQRSVTALEELASKIAAVPLPEVARIAAGVKRSADALDVVVTREEKREASRPYDCLAGVCLNTALSRLSPKVVTFASHRFLREVAICKGKVVRISLVSTWGGEATCKSYNNDRLVEAGSVIQSHSCWGLPDGPSSPDDHQVYKRVSDTFQGLGWEEGPFWGSSHADSYESSKVQGIRDFDIRHGYLSVMSVSSTHPKSYELCKESPTQGE